MCDGPGAEAWSYDGMGRVREVGRNTLGYLAYTTYAYNDDGSVADVAFINGVPTISPAFLALAYTPGGRGGPYPKPTVLATPTRPAFTTLPPVRSPR